MLSTESSAHACKAGERAGGVGAARDLEQLEALGVTHVVNASPIVPCFHRKRLRYRSICVYDDEQDDIAQHFAAAIAFIAKVRCYVSCCTCRHAVAALSLQPHPVDDDMPWCQGLAELSSKAKYRWQLDDLACLLCLRGGGVAVCSCTAMRGRAGPARS